MLAREEWSIPKVSPVKPDVFSLESLIAWLEERPADGIYEVGDIGQCLLAQFGVAMGAADARNISCKLGDINLFADIAFPMCWDYGDCTFGAALSRARASTGKASE